MPEIVSTDSLGRATFVYFAPLVTLSTFDFLSASFTGDGRYLSSVCAREVAILPRLMREMVEKAVENVKSTGEVLGVPVENELVRAVENAIVRGNLGAVLTITAEAGRPELSKSYERENIRSRLGKVIAGEKVEVVIESDTKEGRTVLINLDNRVLPGGWIREVWLDNELASLADDYVDVLNPYNDNGRPEYLILVGGRGAQILVSIPHFSTRTITIRGPIAAAPARWTPALIAVGVLVIVLILLLVFRTRFRAIG
jgi:hypothetical protein